MFVIRRSQWEASINSGRYAEQRINVRARNALSIRQKLLCATPTRFGQHTNHPALRALDG